MMALGAGFMFAIAGMYLLASLSFFFAGQPMWFLLCFTWSVGSAVLALMAIQ